MARQDGIGILAEGGGLWCQRGTALCSAARAVPAHDGRGMLLPGRRAAGVLLAPARLLEHAPRLRWVQGTSAGIGELLGDVEIPGEGRVWSINDDAFERADAYRAIIKAPQGAA